MTRILFFAPLKAPDHPTPSGDRTVGRLIVRALKRAGYGVELASRLRTRLADAGYERVRREFALERGIDDLERRFKADG